MEPSSHEHVHNISIKKRRRKKVTWKLPTAGKGMEDWKHMVGRTVDGGPESATYGGKLARS